MNTNQLKAYAPKARRDFIEAATARATHFGLSADNTEPMTEEGEVVLIGGRPFPKAVGAKRKTLEDRIKKQGFEQTIEAVAYTWFNRLVAIRYMELHGYLDHGYRVLSHPEAESKGSIAPEIVEHAEQIDLPGLNKEQVIELKLDGGKDEELYRLLLLAQCNALHKAMPFLFEKVGTADELLLPANLLHTDSLIRQLVEQIDEELWQEIEIIGWLYQFYISEKKDEVIGKVVKSEDIPAATQLFTPNWIVKYMVQNSLGAQWLATYPQSSLKGQMEYYIEPAEQTDEVNAQLTAITPKELNPEELTLIDPASGSGHILVEAYDLFKAIYLERGYRQRDIAKLILEKNLFGLDIDERAAQLTGFALLMKGRADDRRMFEHGVKLNVMALADSTDFNAEELAEGIDLEEYGLVASDLLILKQLFEHATTFGSLIQVPEGLAAKLPELKQLSELTGQKWFIDVALKQLGPFVQQAELLASQYDAVVANPPYMSSKSMNASVRKFAKSNYPNSKSDTYTMFVERYVEAVKTSGSCAFVTPYTWMFLSTHEAFRSLLYSGRSIRSLVKPSYTSFFESAIVPLVTFIVTNCIENLRGRYTGLGYLGRGDEQAGRLLSAINGSEKFPVYETSYEELLKIPGSPVAYWATSPVFALFTENPSLSDSAVTAIGLFTCDNARFVRQWWEVCLSTIDVSSRLKALSDESAQKWVRYNKGGGYRRWFGANSSVVNLDANACEIRTHRVASGQSAALPGERHFFREGVSWSMITSGDASFRYFPPGLAFDMSSPSLFSGTPYSHLAALNSNVTTFLLNLLNPTLNTSTGTVDLLPDLSSTVTSTDDVVRLIHLVTADWDEYELSWDFQSLPIVSASTKPTLTIESSYASWITQNRDTISEMNRLEEENNRLFIDAYGLADELTQEVPIEQITLTVNPAYRYGGKLTEEEQWTRFREDTMEELVSYAVGCMMGRYSLDEPGLIYAHSGNEGFEPSRYKTFAADEDGIVPLTDTNWFDDDAANRLFEFIANAWPEETLEENLAFLAENLSPNRNETPRETLRRYLCDKFFKDHLKTYKKRPIYWLFSSGKQKAFQCLVYLHRYNAGTLARMRTEYVIPLSGKIDARIEQLDGDITAATSTSHEKKLTKERGKLKKQQIELQAFDEKLKHHADQRIELDLDDGVKVNYSKFGDLLAEVKAVTGKKPEVPS